MVSFQYVNVIKVVNTIVYVEFLSELEFIISALYAGEQMTKRGEEKKERT